MKNFKIIGIILSLFFFSISCEKSDNYAGNRGVAAVPDISKKPSAYFSAKDMDNAYIEVNITIPEGQLATSGSVVASTAGNLERIEVGTIQSFPATFKITLKELASKLGIDFSTITLGDVFTFEVLTSYEGKTYSSASVFTAPVACPYNKALASGSYHVVSADWESEGDVTITVDAKDTSLVYVSGLTAIDGQVEDKGPLPMKINVTTYKVSAAKTILSSVYLKKYTNGAYEGSGTYSSCDGTYTMNFDISVNEGAFGTFTYVFTRN